MKWNSGNVPKKRQPPQLLKAVDYQLKFGDKHRTLPTNYEVYRQVVKAYPQRTPLQLTLGVNDNSVEKAEPQALTISLELQHRTSNHFPNKVVSRLTEEGRLIRGQERVLAPASVWLCCKNF